VQEATLHELVTVLRSVKHYQFLDLLLSSLPDLFQGLVLTELLHMQLNSSSLMESLQNRMEYYHTIGWNGYKGED
jgi:hypothetical protein